MLIYDVGIPCRKGHTTGRYTVSRKCVQCAKDSALAWNRANPEKARKHCAKYRANHPERMSEQYRNRRVNNPDKVKAKDANWQAKNWDKYLEISSSWKQRNRGHVNAKTKERRLAQIQRTPKWLTDQDFADIKKFYDLAHELSQAYGYLTPEYLAKLQQIYDVRANPMVQYTSYVGGQPTLNVVPRSQLINPQQPSGAAKYTQVAKDKSGKPVYLINGEWYDNPEGL